MIARNSSSAASYERAEDNQVKQKIVRHKTSRRPSWGQGAWNFLVERLFVELDFLQLGVPEVFLGPTLGFPNITAVRCRLRIRQTKSRDSNARNGGSVLHAALLSRSLR